MIRSIRINGFQAHLDFWLDLDPSITTILGESNLGKSSILRAMRWVCCNSIRGDDFITWQQDNCRVEVHLENGIEITRNAGKQGNTYQINDGELYKSFRHDVPEEIAKLLNVDDTLNFQGQLDPPYWLSLSSGEVSRELNRIVNLERIDQVLSNCAGEIRKTKAALQVSEERLAKAREERDRLSWVVEAHREYERIASVQDSIAAKTHAFDVLREAIEDATTLAQRVQILLDAKADAVKMMRAIEQVEHLTERAAKLESAIDEAEESWQRCESLSSERTKAQKELDEQTQGQCPVCGGSLPS